ncbi:hypothetical protein KMW28_05920 [Flammeovirga yaeyamensis]|uniref:Lipoprotein n=1 Tax=Flammeovirga yaeyamensis TaxID=367791 RepID=A0AAX1N6M6_9BACT|nr:hypothetical protein [Flammeovirga yaeyamensis]MBB3697705.1 hypothetical protein [Flammeovirga yaeyamensis]NMF35936.1 hypothetical protein [Flammeovirga yaeyamensis]QWG03115.1 hypothetical protein KMW28_05920 [Flammeovirga yaeyamensis]
MKLLFKLLFLLLVSSCSIFEGLENPQVQDYKVFERNINNLINTNNVWAYHIVHVYSNDQLAESIYYERGHFFKNLNIEFKHEIDDNGRIFRSKILENNQPTLYYYYTYNGNDEISSFDIKNENNEVLENISLVYKEDGSIFSKTEEISGTEFIYFYDEHNNIIKINANGYYGESQTLYEFDERFPELYYIHSITYPNGDIEYYWWTDGYFEIKYYKESGEATFWKYVRVQDPNYINLEIWHKTSIDDLFLLYEKESLKLDENDNLILLKKFFLIYEEDDRLSKYRINDKYNDDGKFEIRNIDVFNKGESTDFSWCHLQPIELFEDQKIKSADVFHYSLKLGHVIYEQDEYNEIIGHRFYNTDGILVESPVFDITGAEVLINFYNY